MEQLTMSQYLYLDIGQENNMWILDKIKQAWNWVKRNVKKTLIRVGIVGIATAAVGTTVLVPITPEEIAWKDFTDNLIIIEYKHEGQDISTLTNLKGIWEPTEKQIEEVYQYTYGFDLVAWQKIDGTEMSPLYQTPEGTWERSDMIPHWQQEFNNAKERGEKENNTIKGLRNGVRKNEVNGDGFNATLEQTTDWRNSFVSWLKSLVDIALAAVAVEFEDHFGCVSDIALWSHTPDTTGSGWTLLIDNTPGSTYITCENAEPKYLRPFYTASNSSGQLVEGDDTMSSPDYKIDITQKNGDTVDDPSNIACRITDANNFYVLEFNEDDSDIVVWVAGAEDSRTDGPGIADASTVTLDCTGTTITARDDTVDIIQITDSNHTSAGKAGVGMGYITGNTTDDMDNQNLDDFVVTVVQALAPPEITTSFATSVDETSAILNGAIDIVDATTTYTFFEYGTASDVYTATTTPEIKTANSTFHYELTGLSSETTYYYRAGATTSDPEQFPDFPYYGDEYEFKTVLHRIETQSGNTVITDGNSSIDVTLDNNITDLSRAFLLMWSTGDGGATQAEDHQATGYLWDDSGTTKIKFERDGTDDDALIGYHVVETKNEDFTVQRGGSTITATNASVDIDFGDDITQSRSMAIINSRSNDAGQDIYGGIATTEFKDNDEITVTRGATVDTNTFRYEVVEWSVESGVTVENGEQDCSGNMAAGITETITEVSSADQAWIYTTYRHESNGLEQTAIRSVLTNSTTITYDRYDQTTDYQSYCHWWAVDFNTSDVDVTHLSDEGASGDLTESTPIGGTITEPDSFIWADSNCNGTGTAYPRHIWYHQFEDPENTVSTRGYTTQASQIGIQVIDTTDWAYSEAAPPSVDETVQDVMWFH